jgi:hypothetical protein
MRALGDLWLRIGGAEAFWDRRASAGRGMLIPRGRMASLET